jgi:hypothetical protein
MEIYMFDPHDLCLGTEKKRTQKKRIYTNSRTVSKSIVFLTSSSLTKDHTVTFPSSQQIKKLGECGYIKPIMCKRSWTAEEVRTNVQALAPPDFTDMFFLQQTREQQKTKFLYRSKDISMHDLLAVFHRKYIYVLQV